MMVTAALYDVGVPCPKGHVTGWYVKAKKCVGCVAARGQRYMRDNKEKKSAADRAWYRKNAERRKAQTKAWQLANAERQEAWRLEWRQKNRAKDLANKKRWREANREKVYEYIRNRRARKEGVGGRHSAADIRILRERQRGKCAVCRIALEKKYHIDHIVPIASGGSNDKSNLQLLCVPCNLVKGSTDPVTFMQRRGYLL